MAEALIIILLFAIIAIQKIIYFKLQNQIDLLRQYLVSRLGEDDAV